MGAPRVGKSTLIELALDRSKPVNSPLSVGKVLLEGSVYRLQLLEQSIEDVDFSGGRRLVWPTKLGHTPVPSIDGVVCLYDVTQEESIEDVPEFLGKLPVLSDVLSPLRSVTKFLHSSLHVLTDKEQPRAAPLGFRALRWLGNPTLRPSKEKFFLRSVRS